MQPVAPSGVAPNAPPVMPKLEALPYVPATYGGAAPPPPPPILDMLPWEKKAEEEAERHRREEIRKQKHQQEQARAKASGGGFFKGLTKIVNEVAYVAEKGVSTVVDTAKHTYENQVEKSSLNRWKQYFPDLAATGEHVWHEFYGNAISAGAALTGGSLFVTDRYVAFSGNYSDLKSSPGTCIKRRISFAVPLSTVVSWQHGTTQFGEDKLAAPIIQPCNVIGNALLVFGNDTTLHLFYGFTELKDMLNVFDHAWRKQGGGGAAVVMGMPPSAPPMAGGVAASALPLYAQAPVVGYPPSQGVPADYSQAPPPYEYSK